jgi:hypothetical protein
MSAPDRAFDFSAVSQHQTLQRKQAGAMLQHIGPSIPVMVNQTALPRCGVPPRGSAFA